MPAIVSSARLRLCSGLSVVEDTAAEVTVEPWPGSRLLGKSKRCRLLTGHLPFRTASQMLSILLIITRSYRVEKMEKGVCKVD